MSRGAADVIRDAVANGYTPAQLVAYLEMCNWNEPGTCEWRRWQRERRRIAGRLRRCREDSIEYVGNLPLDWGGED
jgi:hypothetical protein